MYVRFRAFGRRLQASLAETRRVAGKPGSEQVGVLGSVNRDLSARARLMFWAGVPGRLEALANRLRAGEHTKTYAALAARIPMVTPDEQRAIQTENAKDDESFWDAMRDMNAASAEEHKGLIAAAEAK
jgi:hypothetical protein